MYKTTTKRRVTAHRTTAHTGNGHITYPDVEKIKRALVRSAIGKSLRTMKAKTKRANRKLVNFAQRKPVASVGIVTAGVCLALLINRMINH